MFNYSLQIAVPTTIRVANGRPSHQFPIYSAIPVNSVYTRKV